MPDCGRPAKETKRRLQTASYRDPPRNNYGMELLERSQQLSGARKKKGGIMRLANYRGWIVNIRVPKWEDNQLWILSENFETAQYNADAAYYFTGSPPVHFPNVEFNYLPVRLSNGEELTTREKCSAYVAKIAKGSAHRVQRKDFKKRVEKLILEMVRSPEVVKFLNTMRTRPRRACQPPLEPNLLRECAIETSPSAVTVDPFQAEDTHPVIADDGGEENGTPMEVDSLSEMAIRALAPMRTKDPAAVFQFDSTITNFSMDDDLSTAFIPSFEIYFDEHENFLASAGQSLGVWHPHFSKNEKEDLVPDNCKELLASLDKVEEEIWKSIEP